MNLKEEVERLTALYGWEAVASALAEIKRRWGNGRDND